MQDKKRSRHFSGQPLASGRGKFLGNAIINDHLFHSDFTEYWNQVTVGDAGKWGSVETSPGVYHWTALDAIYQYALAHGFPYKHHCLIWSNQQPGFMTDGSLDAAAQRAEAENWIRLVGGRYPNMTMIDVVNEPLIDQPYHVAPAYIDALGGAGTTGWDWVITAFEWARKYCAPGVKLLVNEYGVLWNDNVTDEYIRLIDTLHARGLVDGIGIEGHYFEFKGNGYAWPLSRIKSNLDKIAAIGLPIYVSEFDIDEADDDMQLQSYKTYFPILWEHPAVKGITLWGYTHDDVWKPNAYLINDKGEERPALQWLRRYMISQSAPVPVESMRTIGEAQNR